MSQFFIAGPMKLDSVTETLNAQKMFNEQFPGKRIKHWQVISDERYAQSPLPLYCIIIELEPIEQVVTGYH